MLDKKVQEIVKGALNEFAAHLSTLSKVISVGETEDSTIIEDVLKTFYESRELEGNANIDWHLALKKMKSRQAVEHHVHLNDEMILSLVRGIPVNVITEGFHFVIGNNNHTVTIPSKVFYEMEHYARAGGMNRNFNFVTGKF